MIDELERRTREEYEDEAEGGTVLDYVVRWQESGQTLTALCLEISDKIGLEVNRGALTRYLGETFGDVADVRLERARRVGAHAIAEGNIDIVEDVSASKEAIARAKLQTDVRSWVAGKWNRADYGEPKAGVAVQVNLGSAFLDSLRRQSERARLEVANARALHSDGADPSALPAGSSAIVPAIADEAQDVTFEVLSS